MIKKYLNFMVWLRNYFQNGFYSVKLLLVAVCLLQKKKKKKRKKKEIENKFEKTLTNICKIIQNAFNIHLKIHLF